ncbi:hypothetical protein N7509_011536 [Penicillium cosmopolitanum]|uniref:FAD-binding FR-type domain-containing protein n=1 Tax=Penicillium cosmopolitanum TaxID=1131564 RepID=A0A9W9VDX0_9EURO|nr:uncharacterized protein N7509_011536 [Penicillium cosmopolitanum]KAJ5378417.1 hypothetical protein N7509_011536 [Penicillium cosmopolitanum]
MLRLRWLVIALATQSAWGSGLPQEERCVTAVYSTYNYITFAGTPAGGLWDTRCQNPLKVASIYAASETYCRDSERAAGFAQLALFCEEFGHVELLPRDAVAENLTEDAIRNMRTVDYLELSRGDPVEMPVLISASYFNVMFNTIDSWQYESWSHHAFGYIGYAYWAGILFLGMASRFYSRMIYSRKARPEREVESNTYPATGTKYAIPWMGNSAHWVQTHLTVPAPLPNGRRQLLGFTYTTRAEALAVAGFWLLSTVLSVVGYRTFPGNIYWPNPTDQILRYSADRTGVMSFVNFPLLWLFGGRNNILMWATGWSFATFNIYHRHVARVATLQGVAHSIIYVVIYIRANKLWKGLSKVYVLWGVLAFVVMTLLLITSLDRIRFATYEIFLITHILLSVITLVGCFYHSIVFEGHEYWQYLWPSVGVWVLDWDLRIIRLVYCNMHIGITGRNKVQTTRSRMSYDQDADVIRLEVTPGTKMLQPKPGDYYFLYQPLQLVGWENHPFTVGAWSHDHRFDRSLATASGKQNGLLDVSQLPLLPGNPTMEENQDELGETAEKSDDSGLKLIFWIRPYDGWTQKLRRECLRSKGQTVDTTILLEGPYGHNFPLWRYESVLLIVGGTGIASAVPYIQDHIRRSVGGSDISEEKTQIRDMELVWTARQTAFLQEVASRELWPALGREDFQASFYATRASEVPLPSELAGLGCGISTGRPHIPSLIMSRACDATAAGSTLAILVCGPAGMADEARAATHLAMRQGYQSIKYVEESFAW